MRNNGNWRRVKITHILAYEIQEGNVYGDTWPVYVVSLADEDNGKWGDPWKFRGGFKAERAASFAKEIGRVRKLPVEIEFPFDATVEFKYKGGLQMQLS